MRLQMNSDAGQAHLSSIVYFKLTSPLLSIAMIDAKHCKLKNHSPNKDNAGLEEDGNGDYESEEDSQEKGRFVSGFEFGVCWCFCSSYWCKTEVVVVVLPDPFRGMGAWRNSIETQQSGHALRSELEVKNGRSSAKDGAPERFRCRTISCRGCPQAPQEESLVLSCIGRRTREGWQN